MPDAGVIVRFILSAVACVLGLVLLSRSHFKKPKITAETFSVLFEDSPQQLEAGKLMAEQVRRLSRVRIWSRVVAVLVVLYGVLVPIPQVLALPSGFRQETALCMLLLMLLAIYAVISRLIRGRYLIQPRMVLVLRRFRKRQWRYGVVLDFLKFGCQGLAVPITIQDSSFRGDLPVSLELIQWITFPVLCFAVILSAPFYAPSLPLMFTVWVGGCAVILVVGRWVVRWTAVYRSDSAGYEDMLTRMFARIRRRRLLFSGTQVMKFPDDVWQRAIERCIREADAVVIDISEISDAVGWEINTVRQLIPLERVVLIWADSRSERERVRELQERHLRRIFGQSQESPLPQPIRQVLYKMVPEDWARRCVTLAYDRRRKRFLRTVFTSELAQGLVRCFTYGPASTT